MNHISIEELKWLNIEIFKNLLSKEQIQQIEMRMLVRDSFFRKIYRCKINRSEFQRILQLIKENDIIVVTKLDRFARNTRGSLQFIVALLDANVTLKVLNLGTIENTSMGKMIVGTLLSVAEMKRNTIVEWTQEGKIFARNNNPNYREGRPKAQITPIKRRAYDLLMSGNSY